MDRYKKLDKIGQGTYGTVYKVLDTQTKAVLACKRMTYEEDGISPTAMREIAVLRELSHKNIVQLLDVHMEGNSALYLLFEYLEQDLKAFIDSGAPLCAATRRSLFFQLLSGLDYFHSQRFLHRDLKPQNLLISSTGELKIADLGLARPFSSPSLTYTHEVITLWYRPPEILLGSKRYEPSMDIWSAACIFGELWSRKPMLPGDSEIDQLFKIFRALGTPGDESWPGVSSLPDFKNSFPQWPVRPFSEAMADLCPPLLGDPNAVDVMSYLLRLNPSSRLSARQALRHPYFSDLASFSSSDSEAASAHSSPMKSPPSSGRKMTLG